jgi:hypothetical protein
MTAQERHDAEAEQARVRRPDERLEEERPEQPADAAESNEDARIAAELVQAWVAAERLAQRQQDAVERDVRAEIEAALRRERARQAERRVQEQRKQQAAAAVVDQGRKTEGPLSQTFGPGREAVSRGGSGPTNVCAILDCRRAPQP